MNILVFIDVLKESREPITWLSISRKMHRFLKSKKVGGWWGLRIMSHHPYPTQVDSPHDHQEVNVIMFLSQCY